MKKTLIYYNSRTGFTKRLGEEMHQWMLRNGIDSQIKSITDFSADDLKGIDTLLLGCWTHGLMIILQHPDRKWVDFADKLPDLRGMKIGLFTTYKIATGSMFRKMREHLHCNDDDIRVELKSRNGRLNQELLNKLSGFMEIRPGIDAKQVEKVPVQ